MTTYQPADAPVPGKLVRPKSSTRYCRASDIHKERAGTTPHDAHLDADPSQPLVDDWVDSPSCFSVVRHSIKDMNEDIFADVRKSLPSMEGVSGGGDIDSDDSESDNDDGDGFQKIIFYSKQNKQGSTAAGSSGTTSQSSAAVEATVSTANLKDDPVKAKKEDSDEEEELKEPVLNCDFPPLKGQMPRS
mmetsp:Transcript_20387/g.24484  ORF Transcript_20387/g.24484 Transcript_20387/m.24484 type:complete len:189 (-) Transcript_20387:448-1014(-)|eukprot:CAMPEP_0197845528 /NCGR_PEP_ID=MMETSP1438-20131217/2449_1 /TAXON_ID=1461541 /ORGANISM="Pterosperma sp., Strain CCMP1384" /LENGTH=188 /DNA_ID=CAMNT_0043456855 /DNA_START=370 /DNA_END=936 /DNA_ORIENTATION=-